MSLKITITDIAKALNTTPATVSRALNDHASISPATKQRIRETAAKLNYKRNKIASSLRTGSSGLIGVIIPSAEINFFGSVVHGIESLANANGFNILIFQSNESPEAEARGVETFLGARVDGILASISKNTHDVSHFLAAKAARVPVIFFDRSMDDVGIHAVVIDDVKGGYLATKHLIEQGYRSIAHIAGPQHLEIFNNRLLGYQQALKEFDLPFKKEWVFQGDVSIESGKAAIDYFWSLPNKPDAVFAVEDFTALGVIKALKQKRVKIPAQFGVIGFANEGFGEHISPSLSTIDQQTVQMGKSTFELLQQLMEQTGTRSPKVKKIMLEPIPVFRESSTKK